MRDLAEVLAELDALPRTLDSAQMAEVRALAVETLGTARDNETGDVYLTAQLPDALSLPLGLGTEPAPQHAAELGSWLCERLGPWLECECERRGAVGVLFASSTGQPLLRWIPRSRLS